MMVGFRDGATRATRDNYYGMMQTVWSSPTGFLDEYYGRRESTERRGSAAKCFKELYGEIDKLGD